MSILSSEPDGAGYYYGFAKPDMRQINVNFNVLRGEWAVYVAGDLIGYAQDKDEAEAAAIAWLKANGAPQSPKAMLVDDLADVLLTAINASPCTPTKAELAILIQEELSSWSVRGQSPGRPQNPGEDRTAHAMQELWHAVIAQYEEMATHDKAVALKAKELCREDSVHYTPSDEYLVVMGHADIGATIANRETAVLCYPIQPQWALYIQEAADALAAVEQTVK